MQWLAGATNLKVLVVVSSGAIDHAKYDSPQALTLNSITRALSTFITDSQRRRNSSRSNLVRRVNCIGIAERGGRRKRGEVKGGFEFLTRGEHFNFAQSVIFFYPTSIIVRLGTVYRIPTV